MAKISKRIKQIQEKVEQKAYPINDAINLLKETSNVKFKESIDLAINLGVDPRKSDQVVRGAVTLPHGTGKTVRVAVFAQADNAEKAKQAGADIVGFEDLAASIKAGNLDFDVVIATPDAMPIVGQLGQILGPKGLMPNPKVGTVTADPATAVSNAKAGQARYRTDKAGIIHCSVGKVDFDANKLKENIETVLAALKKAKPNSAKGIYMKKMTLSSTMGAGLSLDQSSLSF